jgi:hypothetical protein
MNNATPSSLPVISLTKETTSVVKVVFGSASAWAFVAHFPSAMETV